MCLKGVENDCVQAVLHLFLLYKGVDYKGKLCVDMSFYTSLFPSCTKPSQQERGGR